jgi:DNA-binding winged helix-turn-helix (wHTH) protein
VPKTEPNCLIRFGVFEVDPRTGELRSKGSRVKLQDQPLQILLALLEKSGEVVTREELRAKLWPADTFVDFDQLESRLGLPTASGSLTPEQIVRRQMCVPVSWR